jgi:ParB/RepB/Spo0J family partition protein
MNAMASNPVTTDFKVAADPQSELGRSIKDRAAEARINAKKGGIKGLATRRTDVIWLNPFDIDVMDDWNSRQMDDPENQEHIDDLARSIAANGVRMPLRVFSSDDGKVYVTDGHCRLLATYRAIEVYGAEVMSIPVMMEGRATSEADRLLTQIIANTGKKLTPLEQSSVFTRLYNLGWDEKQIAERSAKTVNYVKQLLDLQEAPEKIKDMVRSGQVSASLALQTVKSADSSEEAIETLEKALDTAAESGKEKATAKHMTVSKPNIKITVKKTKDVLDNLKVIDEDDEMITVSFSRDDFEVLKSLYKL